MASIFLFGVLSGCVGASSAQAPTMERSGENTPAGPQDVDPNSEFGAVHGTVLSDEQEPLASALVGLRDTGTRMLTGPDGLFSFRDVTPGSYVVDVGALGFETQAREVEVVAGQVTSVSFFLASVPALSESYYAVLPHVGYMECALATAAWISGCSYPYTMAVGGFKNGTCYFGPCVPGTGVDLWSMGAPKDLQENVHRFNITVSQNIGQLQAELFWVPSSAAATRLNLMVVCGDYDWIADDCTIALRYGWENGRAGVSPIKHVVEREDFEDEGGSHKGFYTADSAGTKWDLSANSEIWVMNMVGLPFSDLEDPTTTQVAFGQRFDLWDTLFYNGRGPDDWTVVKDG